MVKREKQQEALKTPNEEIALKDKISYVTFTSS
jgi:hypothetical protein